MGLPVVNRKTGSVYIEGVFTRWAGLEIIKIHLVRFFISDLPVYIRRLAYIPAG